MSMAWIALLGMGLMAAFALDFGGGSSDSDDDESDPPSTEEDEALGDAGVERLEIVGADSGPVAYDTVAGATPSPSENVQRVEDLLDAEIENRSDYEEAGTPFLEDQGFEVTLGDSEDNRLSTAEGDDFAIGWEGDDSIFLGEGDDVVNPNFSLESAGDDSIRGGNGDDLIVDAFGENTLRGDGGRDSLDAIDDSSDRDTPDELIGGFGDDLLSGDNGDTMSGGPGEDDFDVYSYESTSAAPAVITDYDDSEDLISIIVETDAPKAQDEYDIRFEDNGGDTEIYVDNVLRAVVEGVPPAGISGILVDNYRVL